MQALDIFTMSDLRQGTRELLEDTEQGRLALVTEHGRPAFLAVPFNERLVGYGLHRTMALYFFETGLVTLSQAAQLASLPLEEFLELLDEAGLPTVDYAAEELDKDLENALL
ncbi:MAG: prevent-host-death family protein [bacterium]|nr:prevent-host-death family protein [bacterium]